MTTTVLDHAPAAVTEGSVRSADGTRIGFRRLGRGPGVVMVHGSVSTHSDWMAVAKLLADGFTCIAMDRRGRAKSGEGVGAYSLEREYEDIAAVLGRSRAGPRAGSPLLWRNLRSGRGYALSGAEAGAL